MCNCEGNVYNLSMGCCVPVVANADAYYTKSEIDKKIDEIVIEGGGVTEEKAQDMIDASLVDYALKEEIPSLNGYATEQWVEDKNYLTHHQSLEGYVTENDLTAYTYDKQTIDDKIAEGGIFDPTQYYNKTATDNLLAAKADTANTYTQLEVDAMMVNKVSTTDLVDGYYNKTQSDALYALKSEIPDISGKQDISGMTAYTQTTAFTQHTADTNVHVTSQEKSTWNAKSDFSGSYNDLTDKPTIPTIWHGTKAQYDAIQNKDANTIYLIYEE